MKTMRILAFAATMTGLSALSPAQFVEDFNDLNALSRWDLAFSNAGADAFANLAFDYSLIGVPPAPGNTDTIGGWFSVNDNAPTSTEGASAYNKTGTFTGNYSLAYDAYVGFNADLVGSTEFTTGGINMTGTGVAYQQTGTIVQAGGGGFWFAASNEGGAAQDYRVYKNTTRLDWTVANLAGYRGTNDDPLGCPPHEACNNFYRNLFPIANGFPLAGCIGKKWVRMEINQVNGIIEWKINGTTIAQRADTSTVSGKVMIGHMDPFTSISSNPAQTFSVFDNLSVTDVILPTSVAVLEGEEFDGTVADLGNSDDQRYRIFNDSTTLAGIFEVQGTSTVLSPTSIQVDFELSTERLGLAYAVDLYNFSSNAYQNATGGTATGSDTYYQRTITNNAAQFVSGSGEVKARVSVRPINDEDPSQDGWVIATDQFRWRAW